MKFKESFEENLNEGREEERLAGSRKLNLPGRELYIVGKIMQGSVSPTGTVAKIFISEDSKGAGGYNYDVNYSAKDMGVDKEAKGIEDDYYKGKISKDDMLTRNNKLKDKIATELESMIKKIKLSTSFLKK